MIVCGTAMQRAGRAFRCFARGFKALFAVTFTVKKLQYPANTVVLGKMPTKARTCDEMRRLLTAAGVPVPARARKADLVALVQQQAADVGLQMLPDEDDDDSDGEDEEEPQELLAAFDEEHEIAQALALLKRGYIEEVTRKGYQNMQKKLYMWIYEQQQKGKHGCIKLGRARSEPRQAR